jgi:uncharacterized membrane protein YGL010W
MSNYFNLERSFAFYGAYHHNRINTVIHVCCVPLIFTTSIELVSRIAPSWLTVTLLFFYILSFVVMDPVGGITYAPVLMTYYWVATNVLPEFPSVSLAAFVISWILQFIGHGLFEKRAPALLTNLPQSLHAAVFFVWLEVLFAVGLRKTLKCKLTKAVIQERRTRKFE